jgi:hypothetical protein
VAAPSAAALPPCDYAQFASSPSYAPVVTEQADLLGDGKFEWLIGFRSRNLDELGYPKDEAYFTFARYDAGKGAWEEWFSFPAPQGEGSIDEQSVMCVGDMNNDGKVEVALRLYGYGVSSRPENTYVLAITADGSDGITDPYPIEGSSDDTIMADDFYHGWPGMEIVQAKAIMGSEAHADAHRFHITVWGWKGGLYRKVKDSDTQKAFHDGTLAIEDALGVSFD